MYTCMHTHTHTYTCIITITLNKILALKITNRTLFVNLFTNIPSLKKTNTSHLENHS